jgi:DNA-directed RNA polymerase specialized sigma24 family protein
MRSDYHPFPETHWSLVRRAGALSAQEQQNALLALLTRYEPALRCYLVTVRKIATADADDLLQAFIADKILEEQLLRHADERRGRFRTFLLTCLNNFIRTQQRGRGNSPAVGLEEIAEPVSAFAPASVLLEAEWARSLLKNVLEAMREECERTHRQDVWTVFDRRILAPIVRDEIPEAYEQMAAAGIIDSPSKAANLLVTGKRMYTRLLRRAIAEYEETDEGIDHEIEELRAILSRAPIVESGDADDGQKEREPRV